MEKLQPPSNIKAQGEETDYEEEEEEAVEFFLAGCGANDHGQLGWMPTTSSNIVAQQDEEDCGCSLFTPLDWSIFQPDTTTTGSSPSSKKKVIGTTIAIPPHDEPSTIHQTSTSSLLLLSAISCGESHTVTCWRDGTVYAWGDNTFGQLGLETTSTAAVPPTRVTFFPRNLETNPHQNNATTTMQQQGTNTGASLPLLKSPPISAMVRTIACGSFHTLLVTSDGCLFTCGKNSDGCLGLGTLDDVRPHFTLVTTFPEDQQQQPIVIVGAAAGFAHSLALTQNGTVYSFGRGKEGQLGDGKMGSITTTSSYPLSLSTEISSSIVHVDGISISSSTTFLDSSLTSSEEIKSVSLDTTANSPAHEQLSTRKDHSSNSKCTTTARKGNYQIHSIDKCGIPHKSLVPIAVSGPLTNNPVVLIACSKGGYGSYAVTAKDGCGWRWGLLDASKRKPKKRLGKYALPVPTPLPSPLGVVPVSLEEDTQSHPSSSCPVFNTTTITTTSLVDEANKCKNSNASFSPNNNNNTIISISAGMHHVICVTRSGEAWAMGGPGPFLGLGHGCQMEWLHAPGRVLLPGDILINGVACGETHTLLSSICGKVFACGISSKYLGVLLDDGKAEFAAFNKNITPITVPKEILLLRVASRTKRGETAASMMDKISQDKPDCKTFNSTTKKKVKASFIGEYSYGRESVCSYIKKAYDEAAAAQQRACFVGDPSVLESFEDDEDYWGDGDGDALGYYDIGMNLGTDALSAPYGGGGIVSPTRFAEKSASSSFSSLKRLTSETKRHICNSTLAVGGVILSGGQKIVSAVASGLQVSSSSSSGPTTLPVDTGRRRVAVAPSKLTRSESHHDSFDGLTGNSKRFILMSAGKNFSVLYVADKLDC
jgi:alpha-tubulin suppressor-like RCC1 family protein